jgi:radical SAM protein with 4Fe4S-binding SPASM domain
MGSKWRMMRSGLTVLGKPLMAGTRPIHFQLEPATGCNLKCQMCQVPGYGPERFLNMAFEDFKRIFDQIQPLKVALSGAGEPFLNPELLDFVRYAHENGASVLTTTNFTLASNKLEEIVDSGLNLIKISIDAARPETYEKIRGRDYHDRIVNDIRELQRIKKEKDSPNPYVRLQFILQHDSIGEILEILDLGHELGVNSVYYQPLETLLVSDRKDELTEGVTFEGLKAKLIDARDKAKELGITTNAGILVNSLESYFRKYEEGVPEEPPQRVCLLPWFSMYIVVNGDVRPCCSFADQETLVLGNLLRQSFEEVWNGEKYRKLRQDSIDRKLGYTVCRNCTPNRLRDFVKMAGVLPGFMSGGDSSSETIEG